MKIQVLKMCPKLRGCVQQFKIPCTCAVCRLRHIGYLTWIVEMSKLSDKLYQFPDMKHIKENK